MAVFTYRDLDVWRGAMALVELGYEVTAAFPKSEAFGLSGQLRRAAVSIPSNLAEGHCRRSTRAYLFHVSIALGSHAELETCIELARRLRLLPDTQHQALVARLDATGKRLSRLYQALQRKTTIEAPAPSPEPPVSV